jgi:GNAT superfamily N-acetyltransferase
MTTAQLLERVATPPLVVEQLSDGDLIVVRTAENDDRDGIDRVVRGRPRRRARRLPWRRAQYASPSGFDTGSEMPLVAVRARSGTVVGAAWAQRHATEPRCARMWVAVHQAHRDRGIATVLLERAGATVWANGCRELRQRFAVVDTRMAELVTRLGGACAPAPSGPRAMDVEAPLAGDGGLGVALGAMLWAVARGGLIPAAC